MSKRTRWGPDPGPPDLPSGVQPEQDGLLQCRRCGRWYRQLGQHVVAKHGLSADDYRRIYELPAGRGLHASDILAKRAARGRTLWEQDPGLRERLVPNRTTAAERVERARRARAASVERAAVRQAAVEAGRQAHAAWIASIDARYLPVVQGLGFRSIGEFFGAHAGLTDPRLAELLGCTTKQAANLRRRHDHPPAGRWPAGYVVRHPRIQAPVSIEALAMVPLGCQPIRPGAHLLCLECGRWFRSLAVPGHQPPAGRGRLPAPAPLGRRRAAAPRRGQGQVAGRPTADLGAAQRADWSGRGARRRVPARPRAPRRTEPLPQRRRLRTGWVDRLPTSPLPPRRHERRGGHRAGGDRHGVGPRAPPRGRRHPLPAANAGSRSIAPHERCQNRLIVSARHMRVTGNSCLIGRCCRATVSG